MQPNTNCCRHWWAPEAQRNAATPITTNWYENFGPQDLTPFGRQVPLIDHHPFSAPCILANLSSHDHQNRVAHAAPMAKLALVGWHLLVNPRRHACMVADENAGAHFRYCVVPPLIAHLCSLRMASSRRAVISRMFMSSAMMARRPRFTCAKRKSRCSRAAPASREM